MPVAPCLTPRCSQFATHRGYCEQHAQARDREQHERKAGRTVYATRRWKALRRKKLALNPICERCERELATDVHHTEGVSTSTWDLATLESLCHSCHSRETRAEQLNG